MPYGTKFLRFEVTKPFVRSMFLVTFCLSGCGGGDVEQGQRICIGDGLEVGGQSIVFKGVGSRSSESYEVTDYLFDQFNNAERVVVSFYRGASFPEDSTNGYVVIEGYRLGVLEQALAPRGGEISPCLLVQVEKVAGESG